LTTTDYEKFLTEIKWECKSLDISYEENYQFNKRESRDFPNCKTTYDCSPNMNNEDISANCFDFDLGAIQILPEDEVGRGDEHSWVLLALHKNRKIISDSGLLNNSFTCEYLIL